MHPAVPASDVLLPIKQLRARYGVSNRTVDRWLDRPELGFPAPAQVIANRRYWREADLSAWERSRVLPREAA